MPDNGVPPTTGSLPAARRIAVITAKGLQHVTPEQLSALTADPPPPSTDDTSADADDSHDSPYELKLRQNEYESAFEVHPKHQPRPNLTYQIEPGILRVAFAADRSEQAQVQDLTAMLNELMQELQATFSPSGLVIDIDYATYPAAAERLATHANQDIIYRVVATKLRREDPSAPALLRRYVRNALQVSPMTPELDQLVAAFAMRLQASSIDHCRTVPRHPEPDLGDWLQARHLAINRALPISCNVTFALLPVQPSEVTGTTTRSRARTAAAEAPSAAPGMDAGVHATHPAAAQDAAAPSE